MPKVEQNFNPQIALIGLSATRPRKETFYTTSSRTKRRMNLKWPIVLQQKLRFLKFFSIFATTCKRRHVSIVVVKITKFISTYAIRLTIRAGNIVVRHFQLESFHLKSRTGVYDLMTSKISDFSHPREFIKRVGSKKSTLDIAVSKKGGVGVRIHKSDSKLAYKLSSIFFTSAKRERQIFYVFFGKSERESESSTCFPCKKSHQLTSFWRELFRLCRRKLSKYVKTNK